ncbi:integrase core domain-containing protein [Streptomyces sp. NPDC055134]
MLLSPVRAPRANAFIERWIGGCRRELLDRTLILNARHLRQVLAEYETHFNTHRPHQALGQAAPLGPLPDPIHPDAKVIRRDRLGGAIHEYTQVAQGSRISGTHTTSATPQLSGLTCCSAFRGMPHPRAPCCRWMPSTSATTATASALPTSTSSSRTASATPQAPTRVQRSSTHVPVGTPTESSRSVDRRARSGASTVLGVDTLAAPQQATVWIRSVLSWTD